ncbi:hypothetical protein SS50377_20965 [Spironucleus salmonicida]|uniref:Uncharacterized protein n=1 Tax=Spironucleus salmonicida TaxID=348837 RepID=A0A9P8S2E4_9EUKA|nr:hypothetical protein SS50377_20965 [Spironucleus salmonicida]
MQLVSLITNIYYIQISVIMISIKPTNLLSQKFIYIVFRKQCKVSSSFCQRNPFNNISSTLLCIIFQNYDIKIPNSQHIRAYFGHLFILLYSNTIIQQKLYLIILKYIHINHSDQQNNYQQWNLISNQLDSINIQQKLVELACLMLLQKYKMVQQIILYSIDRYPIQQFLDTLVPNIYVIIINELLIQQLIEFINSFKIAFIVDPIIIPVRNCKQ